MNKIRKIGQHWFEGDIMQEIPILVGNNPILMNITYPFTPKSNAHIRPGHFWPIRLSNGKFACGIVLDLPRERGTHGTRNFYAGLLDWVGDSKPTVESLEASALKVLKQGSVHIKTILEYDEAIEGQIDLGKNNLAPALVVDQINYSLHSKILRGYEVVRKATIEDHVNLENHSTWGYAVMNIQANRLLADKI